MPKSKAFTKIEKSLKQNYLGKPVPKQYQNRYGKRYDKKDIRGFAYAIANSKGIRIDK